MSRASQVYAGVDIGNTKIIITIGRFVNEREFRILGSMVTPSEHFEDGEVLNVDRTAASIAFGIRQLSERFDVRVVDAFFGFSGHIESRQSVSVIDVANREAITQSDLDSLRNQNLASKREGREILDIFVTRYSLDDRMVKNPLGYKGYTLKADFIIVSGRSEQLNMLKKVAEKARLKLHGFVLHQVAAAKTLVSNDAKEAGVVVVDLGADLTKVAVYYNNALLHVSNIRMGGNIVTNDIKALKQITFNAASKVKHDFGYALTDAIMEDSIIPLVDGSHGMGQKQFSLVGLSQIIQARLEVNFDLVANEISKSNFYDAIGYGALLTGGGAYMRKVADLFTARTGIESRVGLPVNPSFMGDTDIMSWPYFAVSTGILLEGIERPFQIPEQRSLFADDEIERDERATKRNSSKSQNGRTEKTKVKGKSLWGGLVKTVGTIFDDEAMDTGKDTAI